MSTTDNAVLATEGARHRSELFEQGTMAWPEALGLTVLIAFVTMLMAGWFDLMLPWGR